MIDIAIIAAGLSFTLYPAWFILLKKGQNKFLFVSSCFGVNLSIHLLLTAIFSPVAIVLVKIVPQLAENNVIHNWIFGLRFIGVIQEYYFIFTFGIVTLVMPHLIYRRYSVFR